MNNIETKNFQTEVSQLLDLVIHSLYSKKEVFLRELISNASDAIDRDRFESLTDASKQADAPYEIRLTPDKAAKTLVVADNGIGMTREEVEANIGTVASSGTRKFLQALKERADAPEMIGQFGVGFYAAFMVAESVEFVTRRRGEPAVVWRSDGRGSYEIGETEAPFEHGTAITLNLRDDMLEYADPWRIRDIVRRYSDYIAHPIVLMPDPSEKPEEKSEDDKGAAARQEAQPETLNSMKAIWKRAKDDVSKEEAAAFYKHIAHTAEDPLSTIHFAAEGATEFCAMLFIPASAPYDLFFPNARQGLQLYARNVFIGDDIKELLPRYLGFMRGVVESSDLPLNVSREMLQDDAVIRRIRKVLVGKIIGNLEDMKKNRPDDFAAFNREFGRLIKEGVHSDWENVDKLKELVLFPSTFSEDETKPVSLADYVSRMPSGQKDIYYLSADSFNAARHSPLLEAFAERGYEVLFFTDPVDEFVADRLREYDGRKLRAIDKGAIDLDGGDDAKDKAKDKDGKDVPTEAEKAFKPLFDYLADRFKDDIKAVRLSSRLTDSACCLVADEHAPSAHMERVMKAFNQEAPKSLRILELNPRHPLMERLLEMAKTDADADALADAADLLYGQARLAEGSPIDDPARFNKLVSAMMLKQA
ncbi:MAG: molecular chaperone HtpG [Kiritimatiellia bacterium]|jgi:molecular chaperone HtpG